MELVLDEILLLKDFWKSCSVPRYSENKHLVPIVCVE